MSVNLAHFIRHSSDQAFQHFSKEMDNAVTSDSQEARQETPSPRQRHHSPPFASQSETSPRAVPETIRVPVPTLGIL